MGAVQASGEEAAETEEGVTIPTTQKLIRCGDHQWAPWCVVCVHLATGTSHQWQRVEGTDNNQDDWVCRECLAKGLDTLTADDLKAICIHCVREMQARDGFDGFKGE